MPIFDLSLQLDYTISGSADFVFNIHPANTPQQQVWDETLLLAPPLTYRMDTDTDLGNRWLRASVGGDAATASVLSVRYEATVDVQPRIEAAAGLRAVPVGALRPEVLRFIYPSRYCQSDLLPASELERFAGTDGYARVQAICDWVRAETQFQPGATNSATCALDTLQNRAGVCRDFAHLMITLCRASGIPARFVTGVDYGADPALGPPDFHAYVEAFLGERWYIFDPTGMTPRNGLLRIGTGSDAGDVAFATMFGNVVGGAPKIRIEASEAVLPVPDDSAVSTAGDGVCPTWRDAVRQPIEQIPDHGAAMHL